MRRELKYMIYGNLTILAIILYVTFDLLTLAIDDTFQDAFTENELNPPEGTPEKPLLIPKIIHQTYKTEDIPEIWKEGQQRCKDLHPDYQYIMWTDEMSKEFITKEYPWFLSTFESYKYPIQRADAIRYFVLFSYGGVYIDLDDGCERKLDRLLTVPAFARKTSPTGISNDVLGSVVGHPFFEKLMHSLKKYDRNWLVPYITIMASTGPLFVSMVWKQYKRWGVPEGGSVRILQPADYKMHTYSFFSITKGSSWHLGDAQFIKSLANHILACVVAGFIFAFFLLYSEYCFYCWLCSKSNESKAAGTPSSSILLNFFDKIKRKISGNRTNNFDLTERLDGQQTSTSSSSERQRQKLNRLRKDSNLPYNILLSDLEKNDPKFTDLSS